MGWGWAVWTAGCRACSSASLGTPATTSAAVSIHPPTGAGSGPHLSGMSFLPSLGWNPLASCCVIGSREGRQIISLRIKVVAIMSCYMSDEVLLFY